MEPTYATEHIATGEVDPSRPVTWILKWTIHMSYAEVKAYEAPYSDTGLVTDVEGEDPLFDADIRWDGCANWGLSTRGLAVHTCCGNDVQSIAELLLYLYKRAGELIPDADEPWGD